MLAGRHRRRPARRTWVDAEVRAGPRRRAAPGHAAARARRTVDDGAEIGPDTTLHATARSAPAPTVVRTHGSDVGDRRRRDGRARSPTCGPARAARRARARSARSSRSRTPTSATGSKVPHLTYVGDATIGERATSARPRCSSTTTACASSARSIGSHVRTGSDTMFIAPVRVGDGAYTGAGTVLRARRPAGCAGGLRRVAAQRSRAGSHEAARTAARRRDGERHAADRGPAVRPTPRRRLGPATTAEEAPPMSTTCRIAPRRRT